MKIQDITIVPICVDRRARYVGFSARISAVYMEFGATSVRDYWLDASGNETGDFHAADAMAEYGGVDLPSFRLLAGAGDDETVVLSMTEWPSREIRDAATKAISVDPRIQATVEEKPVFDGRRLIAGSFRIALEVR